MNTNTFACDFNNLSQYLRAFAFKLTKDSQLADDLFQDTALRAFKNKDKFSANSNMKAWLSTIMKNIFINNFRSKKRWEKVLDNSDSDNLMNLEKNPTHNEGERQLYMDELYELIEGLDEGQKQPLLMRYQGYKYEEISEHMELPLGTIKSRIFLARKVLKKRAALLSKVCLS